jgi:hypothetical protein
MLGNRTMPPAFWVLAAVFFNVYAAAASFY